MNLGAFREDAFRCLYDSVIWRGGRVVYGGGLENRWGVTAPGGSNPSLSAKEILEDVRYG